MLLVINFRFKTYIIDTRVFTKEKAIKALIFFIGFAANMGTVTHC